MKLSRAALYALKGAAYLAGQGDGRLLPSLEIARAGGLPEEFLGKVLKPLVRAGVLAALKGPNGGYRLARPAQEVTVLEVVEAGQGPLCGEVPEVGVPDPLPGLPGLEALCQEVAEAARTALGKVKVSALGKPAGRKGEGKRLRRLGEGP